MKKWFCMVFPALLAKVGMSEMDFSSNSEELLKDNLQSVAQQVQVQTMVRPHHQAEILEGNQATDM